MVIKIEQPEDLLKDLAGTHKFISPTDQQDRASAQVDADYHALMRDGYVIIPELLNSQQLHTVRETAKQLLQQTGRNEFEGLNTQRVYALLSKTEQLDWLVEHPRILGLVDRVHDKNYLLSQAQLINILPGEQAQMLHADDGFYRIPRPRPAMGCASIWAIDEFSEHNGATMIIPGSHKWGEERAGSQQECVPLLMPAGSVAFFLGTTIHGGGANTSDAARLAVNLQYCQPYLRQQENFTLGVSKSRAKAMSPQMQSMLGYSIAPPFMGMVDGQHPLRLLEQE